MAAPISDILNTMNQQAPSPSRPSHLLSAANALNTMRDGAALMSNGAFEAANALMALIHEDSQLAARRIEAEARAANHGQAPLRAIDSEDSTEAQGRHHSSSPDDNILALHDLKRGPPDDSYTTPSPPAKRRKLSPKEQATAITELNEEIASRRRDLPPVPIFPWTDTPSQKRKTPDDEDENLTPSQPAKRTRRTRATSNKKGKQRAASVDPSAPRTETPRESYLLTGPGQATQGKNVITGEKAIKAIDPLQLTSPVASYTKSALGKKYRDVAVARLAELESGDGEPNPLFDAETETAQIRRSLAALDDEHTTHYPRALASAETMERWNQPRPAIDEADVPPLKDFVPPGPSERDEVGLTTPTRWQEMFAPQEDRYSLKALMDDELENEKKFNRWTDEGTKRKIEEKQKKEDEENERVAQEGREIAIAADRKVLWSTKKGNRGLKEAEDGKKVEEKQAVKDVETVKEVENMEETTADTGRRVRKPSKRQLEMEEELAIGRKKK